jgi:hypothetical protein
MGECSEQIQTCLGGLLSRFALEIRSLSKQLIVTQESANKVRMKQMEATKQDRQHHQCIRFLIDFRPAGRTLFHQHG